MAITTIDQAYLTQFNKNFYHLLSSSGSKLKGLFMEKHEKGEKVMFPRFGKLAVYEQTSAAQEVIEQEAAYSMRMLTSKLYRLPVMVDEMFDVNKMILDPTSHIVQEMAKAHGRNFDQVVFAAMLGTAATGRDGSGSASFTAGNVIPHGGTGLTVLKLDQAIRLLKQKFNDLQRDGIYLILNAAAEEDLLADAKITSFDYQNNKVLGGKDLPSYRGLKIVMSEDIPDVSAGVTGRALLCTSQTMGVNILEDFQTSIDRIPHRSNANLVQTAMQFGAVRMDEDTVIDINFAL